MNGGRWLLAGCLLLLGGSLVLEYCCPESEPPGPPEEQVTFPVPDGAVPYGGSLELQAEKVSLTDLKPPPELELSGLAVALQPYLLEQLTCSGIWRGQPFTAEFQAGGNLRLQLGAQRFSGEVDWTGKRLLLRSRRVNGAFLRQFPGDFPLALQQAPSESGWEAEVRWKRNWSFDRLLLRSAEARPAAWTWTVAGLRLETTGRAEFRRVGPAWSLEFSDPVRIGELGRLEHCRLEGDQSRTEELFSGTFIPAGGGTGLPLKGTLDRIKGALRIQNSELPPGTVLPFGNYRLESSAAHLKWENDGWTIHGQVARLTGETPAALVTGGRFELAGTLRQKTPEKRFKLQVTDSQIAGGEGDYAKVGKMTVEIDGSAVKTVLELEKGVLKGTDFRSGRLEIETSSGKPPVRRGVLEHPARRFGRWRLTGDRATVDGAGQRWESVAAGCGPWLLRAATAAIGDGRFTLPQPTLQGDGWTGTARTVAVDGARLSGSGFQLKSDDSAIAVTAEQAEFGVNGWTIQGGTFRGDGVTVSGIRLTRRENQGSLETAAVTGAGPLIASLKAELTWLPGALTFRGTAAAPIVGGSGLYFTGRTGSARLPRQFTADFKLPALELRTPVAARDLNSALPAVTVSGQLAGEGTLSFREGHFRVGYRLQLTRGTLTGTGIRAGEVRATLSAFPVPARLELELRSPLLELEGLSATDVHVDLIRETDAWLLRAASDRGLLGRRQLLAPVDPTQEEVVLAVTAYPAGELYRELGVAGAKLTGTLSGTLRYRRSAESTPRWRLTGGELVGSGLRWQGLPGPLEKTANAEFAAALLADFRADQLQLAFQNGTLTLTAEGAPAAPLPWELGPDHRFRPSANGEKHFDQRLKISCKMFLDQKLGK